MTDWELKEVIRSCRLKIKRARENKRAEIKASHAERLPALCLFDGKCGWRPEWNKTFARDPESSVCVVVGTKYLEKDMKSGHFTPIFV